MCFTHCHWTGIYGSHICFYSCVCQESGNCVQSVHFVVCGSCFRCVSGSLCLRLSCVVGALSHITSTATRSGDSAVHNHSALMVRNGPVILLKQLERALDISSRVFHLSEKPNNHYLQFDSECVWCLIKWSTAKSSWKTTMMCYSLTKWTQKNSYAFNNK